MLVSFTSVCLNFGILPRNGSAYHMCCMSYQMPSTLSTNVLHNSSYNFLFLIPSVALWVAACQLSLSAYTFVHGQSLLCFPLHLAPFSASSAPPLFGPILIIVHCLFLLYVWSISSFIISCIISLSSIPLINCSLSHLSCSMELHSAGFYVKSTHPTLCEFIPFTV